MSREKEKRTSQSGHVDDSNLISLSRLEMEFGIIINPFSRSNSLGRREILIFMKNVDRRRI
jgi:hypothetical protein